MIVDSLVIGGLRLDWRLVVHLLSITNQESEITNESQITDREI
jgi:hypothetical protein